MWHLKILVFLPIKVYYQISLLIHSGELCSDFYNEFEESNSICVAHKKENNKDVFCRASINRVSNDSSTIFNSVKLGWEWQSLDGRILWSLGGSGSFLSRLPSQVWKGKLPISLHKAHRLSFKDMNNLIIWPIYLSRLEDPGLLEEACWRWQGFMSKLKRHKQRINYN